MRVQFMNLCPMISDCCLENVVGGCELGGGRVRCGNAVPLPPLPQRLHQGPTGGVTGRPETMCRGTMCYRPLN